MPWFVVRAFTGDRGVTTTNKARGYHTGYWVCLPMGHTTSLLLSRHCLAEELRLSHLSQPCFSVTVLAEVTVPTVHPALAAQTSGPLDSQVLNCWLLEHMVEGKLLPILDCLKTLHCELWQFRKWVMSSLDVQAGSTAGTSVFIS